MNEVEVWVVLLDFPLTFLLKKKTRKKNKKIHAVSPRCFFLLFILLTIVFLGSCDLTGNLHTFCIFLRFNYLILRSKKKIYILNNRETDSEWMSLRRWAKEIDTSGRIHWKGWKWSERERERASSQPQHFQFNCTWYNIYQNLAAKW